MDLMELVAKLTLDKSGYEEGLENAEESASSFGGKLASGLKTAGVVTAGMVAAVGGAAVSVGKSFVDSAGDVAQYGDEIDKASQKMGISAEAYQEWDAILQHSGSSIGAMSKGMITLQKNAVNSADKFEKLGLTQEQVASMSTEELFSATIAGLQNMGESAERTALAQELLGGSVKELGPLLNTSAEDTEAMRQRVHELGGVMSNDAVKAAAAYQDSLQDMQTAFSGLKNNLMADFLPSMVNVMDGITDLFSGDSDNGLGKIRDGIDKIIDGITEKLPDLISTGAEIVKSLAQAVIENLPALFKAGADVVMQLANAVIENLPDLFDAAISIVMAIADGIIDNLPTLIPAAIEAILTIVDKLTDPDTLMKLIDAAFQIIGALAQGLIEAIPQLIEKAPVIIMNFIEAIIRLLPQIFATGGKIIVQLGNGIVNMIPEAIKAIGKVFAKIQETISKKIKEALNWGKDLVKSFANGIIGGFSFITDAMSSLGSLISKFIHFSEPDLGPLSNFESYAPDMMKTFAEGIRDNEDMIRNAVSEAFDFSDAMNLNPSITANPMPVSTGRMNPTQLTVILELDRQALGKTVYKLNNEETQRVGVKLAGGYV